MDTLSDGFVVNWFCILITGIIIAGHMTWVCERESNTAMFPRNMQAGGQQGVWWAMITVSTVGYGDTLPKSGAGRVITMLWIVIGFVAAASVVGSIAGAMSEVAIQDDILVGKGLRGVKVCTYTSYVSVINSLSPDIIPTGGTDDINVCFDMLKAGQVEAVVYDKPILLASQVRDADLAKFTISPSSNPLHPLSKPYDLAPAISANSLINDKVRWAFSYQLLSTDSYNGMYGRSFGDATGESSTVVSEPVNIVLFSICLVLLSLYTIMQCIPTSIQSNIPCSELLFGVKPATEMIPATEDPCKADCKDSETLLDGTALVPGPTMVVDPEDKSEEGEQEQGEGSVSSIFKLPPGETLDDVVAKMFERYDLDSSGTINSHVELRQLVTNVMFHASADNAATEEMTARMNVIEGDLNWDKKQFMVWFEEGIRSIEAGLSTAGLQDSLSKEPQDSLSKEPDPQ